MARNSFYTGSVANAIEIDTSASEAAASATAAAIDANKKSGDAETRRVTLEGTLEQQRANMQDVINPYKDLTNQYANLSVATNASRFQAEEADVALANTLDTLRATGASAGGATALAQAALKSKQGISANLEQQEVANEKLKAQGATQVEQMKAQGEQWKWLQENEREMMDLDRTQAQIDQERLMESEAEAAKWQAIGQIGGSVTSGMGNIIAGGKLDAAAAGG